MQIKITDTLILTTSFFVPFKEFSVVLHENREEVQHFESNKMSRVKEQVECAHADKTLKGGTVVRDLVLNFKEADYTVGSRHELEAEDE